jgi:cystathionine beta-lyase/cystathionine gamma-synthase
MAAIHLSCVVASRGRPVVAPGDVYGGTLRLLKHDLPRAGITTRVVDGNDDAQLDAALDGAGLLLVETISNPAMRVYDIHDLCRRAHARDVEVIVDNTFASPILCRPLRAGADMVMHSSTKYLSGHGDAMGGGLVYRREFDQEMRRVAISYGPSPGPFDSWLALRGLRTLALRVESASRNAEVVAAWLSQHPAVARVYYPGLSGHPSHAVAARVLEGGFGGMLAFDLKRGGEAASRACRRMNLITIMPSLADVATTVSHPFSTSHRGLTEDELALAGVTPGMLRLSAGIEDPDDIVADLEQALAGA